LGSIAGTNDDASREPAPRLDLTVDEKTLAGLVHLSSNQTKASIELAASILCRKSKQQIKKAGF
jgi:hypothetical protein